ncbi:NDR1/HIN1-like protein 1 [Phalaenopsis equestris]|uniref:NDR1/HIN1-like protein 1 n=1 Tax=Phalaenopsis equestris TaxID=78828 RepID=UPI0009E3C098|nr:NDR1/HIN1-like protein 1 [Phalaenopsis equestris]
MAKPTIFSRYIPGSAARLLCSALAVLLILSGIIALILYLIYHPSHPHFTVLSAAIFRLTSSSSPTPATAISTSFQFTISIRNPNHRSTIQYDGLCIYVSYRDQPITPPSSLPSIYQESDGTVTVSPVIGGEAVPVSAEVESALMTEEAYGVVPLRLVISGRVKYRPGPFRSGWVNVFVKCDVLVGYRKGVSGQVPLLGQNECDVDT